MDLKVRYLVRKPGRGGGLPRWFWQPAAALREQGWEARRVPANWQDHSDAATLEAAAFHAAQALNDQVDLSRKAKADQTAAAAGVPVEDLAPALRRDLALRVSARSIDALIRLFKTTKTPGAFLVKKNGKPRPRSTRKSYEQCLERISLWAGSAPVLAVTPKRIAVLKASMAATPAFCNAVVRVLRLLLEFARREEWLQINPARNPGLVGTDPSGLLWPREAVTLFAAAADAVGRPSMGTAVVLNEWFGQREGDIIRLPRQVVQRNLEGAITIRQGKMQDYGVAVTLPIGMVPHLVARADAELGRLTARYKDAVVQPATLIVSEETGQPYKEHNFSHVFARIRGHLADTMRKAAGWYQRDDDSWWHDDVALRFHNLPALERDKQMALEARRAASFDVDYLMPGRNSTDPDAFRIFVDELQFMHLRHTAVTRLAEAGCDDELISQITGHSPNTVKEILKRYLVRTRKLARIAFQKRLDAEGISPPAPVLQLPAPKESGQ